MFNVMADNTVNITASQDGAIYDVFSGRQNFIIEGIGTEFQLSTTTSSLQVTVGSGEALISGRHISATESNTITLPASSTLYLCLRIDLTQTAGNEGQLVALTTEGAMESGNLNAGDTKCDILLYKVITTTSGVSSSTDMRAIKDSTGGAIYQMINQTLSGFTAYSSTSNTDVSYYKDVTCPSSTASMVAEPVADVLNSKMVDVSTCIATDAMEGKVRMYFTNQPSAYILKAFILTQVKELN